MNYERYLPLHSLLSQMLVAFTIEVDNEWEYRYWINANPAPFRTSLVMWANFLRFVDGTGIKVHELSKKAGYPPSKIHPNLTGMIRWGYVDIDSINPKKPKPNDIVRSTSIGIRSAGTWELLVDEIEDRWVKRFGYDRVYGLKEALISIILTLNRPVPHYFPVLDHLKGMRVRIPHIPDCDPIKDLALPYLLSQAHLLFSLDAEQISEISLAIRSNVIRVLDFEPIAKKELPQRSGISKEAISMAINYLIKKGLVIEEPSSKGRGKVVRLTEQGKVEKQRYHEIINSVENIWKEKISVGQFENLYSSLESFFQQDSEIKLLLFQGMIPPDPKLWRAKRKGQIILPHHSMVLYRGGWPDGN